MTEQFYIDQPQFLKYDVHPVTKTRCQVYTNKDGESLYFSTSTDNLLPQIGDHVYNKCNGLGWALVVGYSRADEWLGLMTKFLDPPGFYLLNVREANRRPDSPEWSKRGIGITFGIDIDFNKKEEAANATGSPG